MTNAYTGPEKRERPRPKTIRADAHFDLERRVTKVERNLHEARTSDLDIRHEMQTLNINVSNLFGDLKRGMRLISFWLAMITMMVGVMAMALVVALSR